MPKKGKEAVAKGLHLNFFSNELDNSCGKDAKVMLPTYGKTDYNTLMPYRPITLESVAEKVMERVFTHRLDLKLSQLAILNTASLML